MRRILGLSLLLPAVLGTCGPLRQTQRSRVEQVPAVAVDNRNPLPFWPYANDNPADRCGSPYDPEGPGIRCVDELGVCTTMDYGVDQPMFHPETFRCGPDSAHWQDVCRLRPPAEWPFYNLKHGECDEFSG